MSTDALGAPARRHGDFWRKEFWQSPDAFKVPPARGLQKSFFFPIVQLIVAEAAAPTFPKGNICPQKQYHLILMEDRAVFLGAVLS